MKSRNRTKQKKSPQCTQIKKVRVCKKERKEKKLRSNFNLGIKGKIDGCRRKGK